MRSRLLVAGSVALLGAVLVSDGSAGAQSVFRWAPRTSSTRPATTSAPTTRPATTQPPTSPPTTAPPTTQSTSGCGGCWIPPLQTPWQIQFSGTLDTTVDATLFDVDGFDTSAATVSALHAAGKRVACYVSAGTYEDWRPDAGSYSPSILGNNLADWPGERWVDVRDVTRPSSTLADILRARISMCAAKGFDAVDFDNVDGYTNNPGFPFTASDQLLFNRWLANEAHAQRLSAALKNDLAQVPQLVATFDWAVNEQCSQYSECDSLLPFVNAGKAVMQIEYSAATTSFCPPANARNFNAIKKKLSLNAYRVACR